MYLALEFMDAGSLEHLVKVRPMVPPFFFSIQIFFAQPSEAVVAAIIKQAVAGLYYLHKEKRQVHRSFKKNHLFSKEKSYLESWKSKNRDLKPGNIIVNRQGLVKISDLGMAKEMGGGETTACFAATFLGTVMYMSPERMKGEPCVRFKFFFFPHLFFLQLLFFVWYLVSGNYRLRSCRLTHLISLSLCCRLHTTRIPMPVRVETLSISCKPFWRGPLLVLRFGSVSIDFSIPAPAANFTPHFHHFLSWVLQFCMFRFR